MSIDTRIEMANLRILSVRLSRRCLAINDPLTLELAQSITKASARLSNQAETDAGMPSAQGLDVPLHLLDTPANRRYLAALEAAYEAAIAVDRERGYEDGEGVAEQEIAELLWDVRQEVFGPTDGGRE